jgi:hypothetical protein
MTIEFREHPEGEAEPVKRRSVLIYDDPYLTADPEDLVPVFKRMALSAHYDFRARVGQEWRQAAREDEADDAE